MKEVRIKIAPEQEATLEKLGEALKRSGYKEAITKTDLIRYLINSETLQQNGQSARLTMPQLRRVIGVAMGKALNVAGIRPSKEALEQKYADEGFQLAVSIFFEIVESYEREKPAIIEELEKAYEDKEVLN